jgi:hypothetical protein
MKLVHIHFGEKFPSTLILHANEAKRMRLQLIGTSISKENFFPKNGR